MTELLVIDQATSITTSGERMHQAGQAANQAAARGVFVEYQNRKARNTNRRQAGDLAAFADFLNAAGVAAGDLVNDPSAWRGVTWGLVEAFKAWQLQAGYAISTINFRLSTVKLYCKLALKAGAISANDYAFIAAVNGFAREEVKHLDDARTKAGTPTRAGAKKAEAVSLTPAQGRQLKEQPNTPQGRRDAVLMAILLDHGLRCGEVALLTVENIDMERGIMTFDRPKVQRVQNHKLTKATLAAIKAYLSHDHFLLTGALLLASTKGGRRGAGGGKLGGLGMSERAITKRVAYLGRLIGVDGLSAHDCRHYWATQAVRNGTHIERLKDAGGWKSLAMPGRYIEAAKIANEGVNLGAD